MNAKVRKTLIGMVSMFLLVAAGSVNGQGTAGGIDRTVYKVIYVDGSVKFLTSGVWSGLNPGDTVNAEVSLKLEAKAVLEIEGPDGTLWTFSKEGDFLLSRLIEESQTLKKSGLEQAIEQRLKFLGGGGSRGTTTAGVRGADASGTSILKAGDLVYDQLIEQGLKGFETGEFDAAQRYFDEALEISSGGAEVQAAVLSARTSLIRGRVSDALYVLEGMMPVQGAAWTAEYYLVLGQALALSLDFVSAESAFRNAMNSLGNQAPAELKAGIYPPALLGLGFCKRGLGDEPGARKIWADLMTAWPQSEETAVVRSLL